MDELESQLAQIPHFNCVHSHLFTSEQPSLAQLELIKAYGVNSIINVALNDEEHQLDRQDRLCLELGLQYVQLPLLCDNPSSEQAILILDLIDHLVQEHTLWLYSNRPQLVACLMYIYRQFYMDIDLATAHEHLHDVWEPDETATGFMHAMSLQLQGRKATKELQLSLMKTEHFSQ